MKLLLDTAVFLWSLTDDPRLSRQMRAALLEPANERYLSVVSAWEIAVKYKLGKLKLERPPAELVPAECRRTGIDLLPLAPEDIWPLDGLPPLHRDPFDRMLVCQALARGMTLLTADPQLRRYRVPVIG